MRTVKDSFKFTRGLITETSPLNFPENACLSIVNYNLFRTQLIARRLGINAETGFALNPSLPLSQSDLNNAAINSVVWTSVGQVGGLNFLVIQIANILYFHDLSASGAISDNILPFTVDLQGFAKNIGINTGKYQISAVPGNGFLYVVSSAIKPFYISYNALLGGSITTTLLNCVTRDLDGLNDGLAPDENPATLSDTHKYNLLNQSWLDDQITEFFNALHNYPSNAQVPYEAKNTSNVFDPTQFANITTGTTTVARGKFLVNIFDINYSSVSGVPGLPSLVTATRPTGIAFFASRLWLAVNNIVYFSQVITTDPANASKFYQEQDPTAELNNSLLPSDGGYIIINDAAQINSLLATEVSLIVGASNGIWAISSYSGRGFVATEPRVSFITTNAVDGNNNLCQVESTLWIVSTGGIYVLSTTDRGNVTVNNITQDTIQTFYLNIPRIAQQQSTITYDPIAKKVYVLYDPNATGSSSENKYQYTNALVYDLSLEAWYPYAVKPPADKTAFISGSFLLNTPIIVGTQINVFVGSQQVMVGSQKVSIEDRAPLLQEIGIGYVLVAGDSTSGYQYTIGQFDDETFFDFRYVDDIGGDFQSSLITGYQDDTRRNVDAAYGDRYQVDTTKIKGCPYIWVHSELTEQNIIAGIDGQPTYDFPSSTFLQAMWGWANNFGVFITNTKQQVYRFNQYVPIFVSQPFKYPTNVITTKSLLRGHGRCLSIAFTSETGKDSRLWGWAIEYQIADTLS